MFDGFIRDKAHWTPRAPAVITPAGAVAYGRLDADVDRIGHRLLALGLAPQGGALVAVSLESAYLELATLAALARLGLASTPAADSQADRILTEADVPRDVLSAEPHPLPQLELDLDAPGRGRQTWRQIETANFAVLRTLAAGRTGAFVPLNGLDTPEGFALTVCAWSCGAAVATGFAPHDLAAALETLPPGVVVLAPAQLAAVLGALPEGFRPQPAWRLAVALADGPLPPPLARDALARLTPDVRVLHATAQHPLIALGHAADEALVPLADVAVDFDPGS